jgi:tetratricopeptide (TPR) repeat protein
LVYQENLANNLGLYAAHSQLADIYEDRQEFVEAIAERRRAIETFPDDPSLRYDLGRTLAHSRDFPEAAQVLVDAMEANPLNARIPYTLGQVQMRLGDREAARRTLERFLQIAPSRFLTQVNEVKRQLTGMAQ